MRHHDRFDYGAKVQTGTSEWVDLVCELQPRERIAREVVAFLDHEFEQERRAGFSVTPTASLIAADDVGRLLDPASPRRSGPRRPWCSCRRPSSRRTSSSEIFSTSRSAPITPLLNTTVRIAILLRAAVSISMPVMPMAASPITLTQSFFGCGELGAHGDAEPVAELGGLAPAHVGAGRGRLPERHHLLARAAGIVRHDDVVAVDRAHEIADHAILVDRRLVGIEVLAHSAEPRLLGRRRPPP